MNAAVENTTSTSNQNTITLEKVSTLERKLTMVVPNQKLKQEEQSKIAKYAKTMRIAGFRSGKVPTKLIKDRYGKDIHNEVVNEVLDAGLKDAFISKSLQPVSRPVVEEIKDQQDEDLQFIVTFEVLPEVELQPFTAITIEKPIITVTDQDLTDTISRLQDQYAIWEKIDRAAQSGDKITIDFVGTIGGKEFEHGSAKNFDLELGSNKFIPGFEDNLIGAKAGDSLKLNINFPADYGIKNLAGQAAEFAVTVHSVAAKQRAELNVNFAKKLGVTFLEHSVEDQTTKPAELVAKINDKIRENMQKQAAKMVIDAMREQAYEGLLVANKIALPKTLVEDEKQKILEEAHHHHGKAMETDPAKVQEHAEKRTALGILLRKVIGQFAIKVDNTRIQQKLDELSTTFANPDLIRRIYSESKELFDNLTNTVLTEQTADLIIEGATIKEKNYTFTEFANKPKTENQ